MSRNEFINWLEVKTNVSTVTAKKYAGAVNTVSKGLSKYKLLEGSLFNINEPTEIESLKIKYFSIPEFEEKDIRGNRMYSSALNYYKKYKEEVYRN